MNKPSQETEITQLRAENERLRSGETLKEFESAANKVAIERQHEMEKARAEVERLEAAINLHIEMMEANLRKERDDAQAKLAKAEAWRREIDEQLIVSCIGVASDDPKESLNRLLVWTQQVALEAQSRTITKLCLAIDPDSSHGPETDKIYARVAALRVEVEQLRKMSKPLVTALEKIREAGQHLIAGNLVDSQLGSIARDALAHARQHFPEACK